MTRFGVVGGREALVRFCVLDDDDDEDDETLVDSTMITSSSSDSGCSATTSAIFLLRRRLLGVSMFYINMSAFGISVFRVCFHQVQLVSGALCFSTNVTRIWRVILAGKILSPLPTETSGIEFSL